MYKKDIDVFKFFKKNDKGKERESLLITFDVFKYCTDTYNRLPYDMLINNI